VALRLSQRHARVRGLPPGNARTDFDYSFARFYYRARARCGRPVRELPLGGLRYDILGFFFTGGLLTADAVLVDRAAAAPACREEDRRLPLRPGRTPRVVDPGNPDAGTPTTTFPPGEEDRASKTCAGGGGVRALRERRPRVRRPRRAPAAARRRLPVPFDADAWPPASAPEDGRRHGRPLANHRHYKGTQYSARRGWRRCSAKGCRSSSCSWRKMANERGAGGVRAGATCIADQFLIGAYALLAIEGWRSASRCSATSTRDFRAVPSRVGGVSDRQRESGHAGRGAQAPRPRVARSASGWWARGPSTGASTTRSRVWAKMDEIYRGLWRRSRKQSSAAAASRMKRLQRPPRRCPGVGGARAPHARPPAPPPPPPPPPPPRSAMSRPVFTRLQHAPLALVVAHPEPVRGWSVILIFVYERVSPNRSRAPSSCQLFAARPKRAAARTVAFTLGDLVAPAYLCPDVLSIVLYAMDVWRPSKSEDPEPTRRLTPQWYSLMPYCRSRCSDASRRHELAWLVSSRPPLSLSLP
jgi:hypothetical protein